MRKRPHARSHPDDAKQRRDRKRRLEARQAADGFANGVVEIEGPLRAAVEHEIRNLAARVEAKEKRRDRNAAILSVTRVEAALVIETESEKLAQHIADALKRSRKAEIKRFFDDEGARRVLRCRLPSAP